MHRGPWTDHGVADMLVQLCKPSSAHQPLRSSFVGRQQWAAGRAQQKPMAWRRSPGLFAVVLRWRRWLSFSRWPPG
eukprot:12636683-Alexandrium_andersonii.AAC.1